MQRRCFEGAVTEGRCNIADTDAGSADGGVLDVLSVHML